MNQVETSANERASALAKLANTTANELLRLKPNEEELILFLKRLQVVDPSIKYAR